MASLYAILDLPHAGGLDPAAAARGLVKPDPDPTGVAYLQVRYKHASPRELQAALAQVAPICRAAGVPVILNDAVALDDDVMRLVDGIHLGQQDLQALGPRTGWPAQLQALRRQTRDDLIVGISTHNLEQVRETAALPIDYIGFGPVLPTRSKQAPEPCVGFALLRQACQVAVHPVVAIGGLDLASAVQAAACGANMVATISALVASSEPKIRARVQDLARALAVTTRRDL